MNLDGVNGKAIGVSAPSSKTLEQRAIEQLRLMDDGARPNYEVTFDGLFKTHQEQARKAPDITGFHGESQICIFLAPTDEATLLKDTAHFYIALGKTLTATTVLSPPLYLAKLVSITRTGSTDSGTCSWRYYRPRKFTATEHTGVGHKRYIGAALAEGAAEWELDKAEQVAAYDPGEMILAWELENGETRCIPSSQYFDAAVALLVIAKESASSEEADENIMAGNKRKRGGRGGGGGGGERGI
jgi:hypothetical protein